MKPVSPYTGAPSMRGQPALMLNQDQAQFKQLVLDAIQSLARHDRDVSMFSYSGPGYSYQDYVITLKVSRDRRSCELYRNRTGALVFAMLDMVPTAINWEYIFIDKYIESKLKNRNG